MSQVSKQLGHVTLWSDENGEKWETFSFAVDDDLQRRIRGEISDAMYRVLKAARQIDIAFARRMLGESVAETTKGIDDALNG